MSSLLWTKGVCVGGEGSTLLEVGGVSGEEMLSSS